MTKRALLAVLLGAVLAPVSSAETYSVKLTSGDTLQLRYPLEESSWDKNTLVYLSEGGNWVAIPRSQVAQVQIATEFKGQGQLLNATTIFMGLAANDFPEAQNANDANSTERLFDLLNNLSRGPSYSNEQFVEPGEAGGGIPLNLVQPYSPQTGVPPIIPLGSGFGGGSSGDTGGGTLVPADSSSGPSQ